MSTVNATNARKELYRLIESVNESHDPIHITSKRGAAVLVSEDDWKAVEETLFLTAIPGMREYILAGVKEPLGDSSEDLDW